MQSIVVGEITQGGLTMPLKTALKHKNIPNIVLRIRASGLAGSMGVFCGEYITGACITSTGETGQSALEKLMRLEEGIYELLDAGNGLPLELEQALIVEIAPLIGERWQSWDAARLDCPPPAVMPATGNGDPLTAVFGSALEAPTALRHVGVLALDRPVTEDFRKLKEWSETASTLRLMAWALVITMLALTVLLFGQDALDYVRHTWHIQ